MDDNGRIVLYCIVLYCVVLFCVVLYCIVLYASNRIDCYLYKCNKKGICREFLFVKILPFFVSIEIKCDGLLAQFLCSVRFSANVFIYARNRPKKFRGFEKSTPGVTGDFIDSQVLLSLLCLKAFFKPTQCHPRRPRGR